MGVTYDNENQMFVFDFEHDGKEDIVNLTGDGYQVEAFGKCFYYGYEFSEQVDSNVRSAFIKYVKFNDALQDSPELTQFIKKAVDNLDKKINLAKDVKKSRFRPYMLDFLRFASEVDEKLCASIRQQNVLIIDDVTTSGSTLNEILRTLRILNEDNEITIFSLIGRRDLMAEAV